MNAGMGQTSGGMHLHKCVKSGKDEPLQCVILLSIPGIH